MTRTYEPYSASPAPAAPAAPTAAREGAAGERGGAEGFSDATPAEHAAAHRSARVLAAAERYRAACVVYSLADEAKAAAERAHRAAKVDARGLGVEAYDAIVLPVRAALVVAEDAHDDAFAAREAAADALLEAARCEL